MDLESLFLGKFIAVSCCIEDLAVVKEDLLSLEKNQAHFWVNDKVTRDEEWEAVFTKVVCNSNCKGALVYNSPSAFVSETAAKERSIILQRHEDVPSFRIFTINMDGKQLTSIMAEAFALSATREFSLIDQIDSIRRLYAEQVVGILRKDSKQAVNHIMNEIAKPNAVIYEDGADMDDYDNTKTKFNAYEGVEPYLFVSYSHKDVGIVYPILDALYNKKYRLWYDDSCETGNDFRDELRRRIEKASAVLLFVSKKSMESSFCGMEIIVAREYGKKLYPIYLDDAVIPPAFELLLANTHHGTVSNIDKLVRSLLRDLPAETMDRLTVENGYLKRCEDNGDFISVEDGIKTICVGAFKDRKALHNVELPETLETIEAEGFRGCSNLENVDIPFRTVRIGESCFRDCVSLKSLVVLNPRTKISERAFENCASLENISLPDSLMEIYGGVFNSCKSIKHITLPRHLTILGENAFSDCVGLETISIPPSVSKLDDLVFNGCLNLKKIELFEGIKKIGKSTFKNCKALTSVNLPSSLSYIGEAPFRGCEKMKTIVVDKHNKYYKSEPNKREGEDQVLFNKNKSLLIAYPANSREVQYDIPDSVTIISEWAFSESRKLNRITIPDSVNEIREGAFCNCTLLDEIEIPDSVVKIDDCVFRGCLSLERVYIPSSVREIGWGVFDGCEDKVVVYCDQDSVAQEYCVNLGLREMRFPTGGDK